MSKQCTTHHRACDCREEALKDLIVKLVMFSVGPERGYQIAVANIAWKELYGKKLINKDLSIT